VRSGGLLFCRADIDTTLADISATLLDFARWRFDRRRLPARFVNLKDSSLPEARFDMILALDVFEHLVDPVEVVQQLCRAMKPADLLFARIHAEADPSYPQHHGGLQPDLCHDGRARIRGKMARSGIVDAFTVSKVRFTDLSKSALVS
jgi:2-polyprenyl-3-methyl-5-hydroxy-6-metoxy-1,4-benzoquinol methylase